jgi:hypothetical protein
MQKLHNFKNDENNSLLLPDLENFTGYSECTVICRCFERYLEMKFNRSPGPAVFNIFSRKISLQLRTPQTVSA